MLLCIRSSDQGSMIKQLIRKWEIISNTCCFLLCRLSKQSRIFFQVIKIKFCQSKISIPVTNGSTGFTKVTTLSLGVHNQGIECHSLFSDISGCEHTCMNDLLYMCFVSHVTFHIGVVCYIGTLCCYGYMSTSPYHAQIAWLGILNS